MPQLYARVFLQILDSSLSEDYLTRHVFEDFLKLCNRDGVVDMTRQAIARRTNIPLDIINASIGKLEANDPHSRDSDEGGKRLIRLDDHRDWGWRIVNYQKYELVRVSNDMREFNNKRMKNYRDKKKEYPAPKKESTTTTLTPGGNPTCRLQVGNKILYPVKNTNGNCIQEFEEFWNAYPRKSNKYEAERVFVEVNGKDRIKEILNALEWQTKSKAWNKNGGQYIPSPENYLRNGKWHDEQVREKTIAEKNLDITLREVERICSKPLPQ